MNTVFVNPARCIGCRQCEFACAVAHARDQDPVAALSEQPRPYPRIHVEPGAHLDSSFPNKCRHCEPAPCLQVCPTGALGRDVELGLVLVDASRCIACAMCAMVCPFDVITFQLQSVPGHPARVAAHKCDGCVDRVRARREPACAEVCKVDALVWGDLNDLVRARRVATAHIAQEVAREPHPSR